MTRFPTGDLSGLRKDHAEIIAAAAECLEKYGDWKAANFLGHRLEALKGAKLPDYLDAFEASMIKTTFHGWKADAEARLAKFNERKNT